MIQTFGPSTLYLLQLDTISLSALTKKQKNLNIFQVEKLIKKQHDEQKLLSEINGRSEIFEKRWHNWKNLFINI